jgi:hypothetical protein
MMDGTTVLCYSRSGFSAKEMMKMLTSFHRQTFEKADAQSHFLSFTTGDDRRQLLMITDEGNMS